MIELLLKASLAIGIALLFYKLVLQQESFFATNRLYLLGCIIIAFILPFINLPQLVSQQGYLSAAFQKETIVASETSIIHEESLKPIAPQQFEAMANPEVAEEISYSYPSETTEKPEVVPPVQEEQSNQSGYSFTFWLGMLYLFGVAIFSLSLLYQIAVIVYKIVSATDKIRDGEVIIVNTSAKQAPCSFFNYIFIHPDEYHLKTYEQIIAHEKIHAKLGHSLDMIFAELAIIVLWFNPLIWFLKREIEKNNEYQTDSFLLEKQQVRKEQYQMNLLQIAVPNKAFNITTHYNQSLIKQRIIMMNSKKSTSNAYWKYAFLFPLFFGMLLLINEPAVSQEKAAESSETSAVKENVNEKTVVSEKSSELIRERNELIEREGAIRESITDDSVREVLPLRKPTPVREALASSRQVVVSERSVSTNIQGRADMTKGVWYSSREDGELCIQFKGNRDAFTWNIGKCFAEGAFQKKGPETFVMTKETGTLELTGNLDAEVGQGKYIFKENPAFKEFLASQNISGDDENMMFHLFFGGVDKSYITFLKSQYGEIEGRRLTELGIHGVTEESFRNYIALFEKYSNKKPSIREVVEARIHGINEAYVQEIQEMGFSDLSLKKMMEAKIHGVNAGYVKSLIDAGYTNLSIDKIISAKIHGVDPATIKEMKSLGKGEMSIDKVIELQIHRVSADYIQQLESAGLSNLSLDQVVSAKIHGLNPTSIKELRSLGYSNLSFNDMLSAQIHRVDTEYVKNIREAGFTNLSLDEITTAKIHGLDPQSIKEIRALGFKDLSFKDLMSAQIHRVTAEYVKDLQKAGLDNLDINDVVSAKIHGINGEFIEKSRKNGYNLSSIDKYISLKIHGSAMESWKDN